MKENCYFCKGTASTTIPDDKTHQYIYLCGSCYSDYLIAQRQVPIMPVLLRTCPECDNPTNNYYLCDKCCSKAEGKGVSFETLWEKEEDCYVLAGLAKLKSW